MRLALFCSAFSLLSLAAGCTAASAPTPAQPQPEGTTRKARIQALIGDARCDDQSQCHAIGVGAKACGGPATYWAWSTRDTDEKALRRAVEEDAKLAREEIAREGRMSNCVIAPEPQVSCSPRAGLSNEQQRTCQLVTGTAASRAN